MSKLQLLFVAVISTAVLSTWLGLRPPVKRLSVSASETDATTPLLGSSLTGKDIGAKERLPVSDSQLSDVGETARASVLSPNLRLFVAQAKQNPQRGGLYYAYLTLSECRTVSTPRQRLHELEKKLEAPARGSSARSDSLTQLKKHLDRCNDFTADELNKAEELLAVGERDDPVIKARAQMSQLQALSQSQRQQLAKQIVALRDPHLVPVLPHLMQSDGDAQPSGFIYIDGKKAGGVSAKALELAMMLLPCSFGEVCDGSNVTVLLACAEKGLCTRDLFELYRRQLSGRPREQEAMMQTYRRLTEIVVRGDLSAFLPPPTSQAVNRPDLSGSSVPPI